MLGWTLKLSVQLKTEPIYSVLEKVKSCFVTGLISLSRSSTGKQVLLIHSVSRCLLARQSGPMNVFPLRCHMSIEGSWSSQCLTGTSMSSWGMFYDRIHVMDVVHSVHLTVPQVNCFSSWPCNVCEAQNVWLMPLFLPPGFALWDLYCELLMIFVI